MWQKIKCWLGFGHEFEPMCDYCVRLARKMNCPTECTVRGFTCDGNKDKKLMRCKHCGATKR